MSRLPRRVAAILSFCLALAALPAGAALAAPGDLDTTFSEDGALFDALSPYSGDRIRDPKVVQAPDGSLVAATLTEGCGQNGCDLRTFSGIIRLIRVSPAGEVVDDTELPAESIGNLFDLRVLADGTVVLATRRHSEELATTYLDADLEPFDERGGSFVPGYCGESDDIDDAAIRADGTVAGLWNCDEMSGPTVELVDDEAQPVEGFDGSDLGEGVYQGMDLALSPQGVIHVLGSGEGPFSVTRLLNDGARDAAYDDDGVAWMDYNGEGIQPLGEVGAFAVDSQGRAVIGLIGPGQAWRLMRLTGAGAVDETFGTAGIATIAGDSIGGLAKLSIQDDDKILAVGFEGSPQLGRSNVPDHSGLIVARVGTDGQLDSAFGTAGFVLLEVDDQSRRLDPVGPALQQADGQIVVPAGLPYRAVVNRAAVAAPPQTQSYLGLFRVIGRIPAPVTTPPQAVQQQQQQVEASLKACVSNRRLRIRLRTGRRPHQRSRIVSARVWVNGRRVKVTRGNRLGARIDLRNLPKGRFSVKIRLRLADGGIVRETRRYRTCAPRISHELKPLRTYPPKRG